MTIAITVKVNDGIVLAADSASTLQGSDGLVWTVYNNADKVFNLRKGKPVGALTWGAGNIGISSISTLVKDFRRGLGDNDVRSVKNVAALLCTFMKEKASKEDYSEAAAPPFLGFRVAGYSDTEDVAEEYRFYLQGKEASDPVPTRAGNDAGITWDGEPEAIQRLVLGYSSAFPAMLLELGVEQAELDRIVSGIRQRTEATLVTPPMPIMDAIDLADFLARTASSFSRFTLGAQTVGGPIDIAAITKHEGFKWIKRKHYYNRNLNPE